jgi:hypothetical protein
MKAPVGVFSTMPLSASAVAVAGSNTSSTGSSFLTTVLGNCLNRIHDENVPFSFIFFYFLLFSFYHYIKTKSNYIILNHIYIYFFKSN